MENFIGDLLKVRMLEMGMSLKNYQLEAQKILVASVSLCHLLNNTFEKYTNSEDYSQNKTFTNSNFSINKCIFGETLLVFKTLQSV